MKAPTTLPIWSVAAPLGAWLVLAGAAPGIDAGGVRLVLGAAGVVAGVLAAVFHAEVIAHRVGEPFGTLVLAVAVTAIETALIVSLMVAGGAATTVLARDTVFAAVMIILNGMVGLCLVAGGARHREQSFGQHGVSAALATLAAIAVLTLVLPNDALAGTRPHGDGMQLAFSAAVSAILYGMFILVQTVRHRDYFLPMPSGDDDAHAPAPSARLAWMSAALLPACLAAVVLLAKALSPALEKAVQAAGAPQSLVGIIIAGVVLLPEAIAAFHAARADRLQTSLNLALGSALAGIGLTIPAVALVALVTGLPVTLGIDSRSSVLLALSVIVAGLSLGTGRTTIMQGTVHLAIFAVYLFTAIAG